MTLVKDSRDLCVAVVEYENGVDLLQIGWNKTSTMDHLLSRLLDFGVERYTWAVT
jgi:hypothetical protein